MSLLHIEKVKENTAAFEQKVVDISKSLGIKPNWLMQVMYIESSLNHRIVNKDTSATGLIQFMPNTARSLGTTIADLAAMSNVAQLDYVYKYLAPYKSKLKRYVDVYMTVFFPAAVGKSNDAVIKTNTLSAATIARVNPAYDLDKNKEISVGEIYKAILKRVPAEFLSEFSDEKKNC